MSVLYHPDKANVVADALSRLSMGSVAHVDDERKELVRDVHRLARLGVQLVDSTKGGIMFHNGSESSFVADVKAKQCLDLTLVELKEAWEDLNMDFIVGLPRTRHQYDSIWVIVDQMSKSAYFIPVKVFYTAEDYAKLYLREMVRLHGVPLSIISDKGGVDFLSGGLKWGVMRFGKKGKLSPRFVVPYQILRRIGKVAYELDLPSELAWVHPVFHVSMLKKYVGESKSIIPREGLELKDNLSYEEVLIEILDRQVKRLRKKKLPP
ncbi:hypothetical protein MTR67_023156 [Solanum verrucosum]|uniref:Tf2-1-like SH3-like domain-containing protein n=1 Tax=Solanum verrucosum TaxID=315347 RepID=A0AAF0R0E0_SOLVR|nr:hypothetical protein MTR67_023156 [Solanum verrucosum]